MDVLPWGDRSWDSCPAGLPDTEARCFLCVHARECAWTCECACVYTCVLNSSLIIHIVSNLDPGGFEAAPTDPSSTLCSLFFCLTGKHGRSHDSSRLCRAGQDTSLPVRVYSHTEGACSLHIVLPWLLLRHSGLFTQMDLYLVPVNCRGGSSHQLTPEGQSDSHIV